MSTIFDLQPLLAIEPVSISISTLAWLVVSIFATLKVVRNTEGAATPVWLLVVWFVPCFGAIAALLFVKKKGGQSPE